MRVLRMLGALMLAAAVALPGNAIAKDGKGSGGSGMGKGYGGSGMGKNYGGNYYWGDGRYYGGNYWNWNRGWRNWYPYYGYDYGDYYLDETPVYQTPVFSGLPIKIVNPANSGVTLTYSLNGETYTIPPGYSQKFAEDRNWVIQFSRGSGRGVAEYSLEPGVFTFGFGNNGWDLFRGTPNAPAGGPTNPMPPQVTPENPAPRILNAPPTR
ncbi:MAG: hypothetical protein ABFC96_04880 [Thermoguttaceae bacterium]